MSLGGTEQNDVFPREVINLANQLFFLPMLPLIRSTLGLAAKSGYSDRYPVNGPPAIHNSALGYDSLISALI